jgi:hypothetical protein
MRTSYLSFEGVIALVVVACATVACAQGPPPGGPSAPAQERGVAPPALPEHGSEDPTCGEEVLSFRSIRLFR